MPENWWSNWQTWYISTMGSSHVDTGKIVPVAEEDQYKTVFATQLEHSQFWVMPLGLRGAPATFQWMMDHLIEGLEDFTADCLTSSCHLQWKLGGAPITPTECTTHITGGCAPDCHLPVATDSRHAAGTAASRSCNEQEKEYTALVLVKHMMWVKYATSLSMGLSLWKYFSVKVRSKEEASQPPLQNQMGLYSQCL